MTQAISNTRQIASGIRKNLRAANKLLGRSYSSSNNATMLAAIAAHLGQSKRSRGGSFPDNLAGLLRRHKIRHLLEVGPFEGHFLQAFAGVAQAGGTSLYAIEPSAHVIRTDRFPRSVQLRQGYICDLPELFPEKKLDLIVSCGVFTPGAYFSYGMTRTYQPAIDAFKLMLAALSPNPRSACIAVSFNHDYLIPRREDFESLGQIRYWLGLADFAKLVILQPH